MERTLKPGNGLYRAKGKVQHAGTYWKDGKVVEHGPKGVRVISYEEFADGQEVQVLANEVALEVLELRIKIVLTVTGKYNFALNNCEHVASYLQTGSKSSEQVLLSSIGGSLGVALARTMGGNVWGQLLGLAVGAYVGHTLACNSITSKSQSLRADLAT